MTTNKLYAYNYDCGRMGEIEGTFISNDETLNKLKDKTAYFGEALGKHSDIADYDWFDNVTELTDDQDFITKAIEYGIAHFGYSPQS